MKNKTTAILLALFLGWLWFHRFYLWNYIVWILYIIFMFTFIPLLLSLVEVLYFALMNKKDFDIKYNAEYIKNKRIIENN